MALMEFLGDNLLNTTTQVKVDSATSLTKYLFDRNIKADYESFGYSSDTSTIISVEFDDPTVISNVLLQNHNFKQFRLFYNSVTANTLTPDANVSSNSETSTYFVFSSITVNSIQLQIDSAMTADTEKSIGELVITERKLQFPQNPSSINFKPLIDRTQVKHKMPDGGIVLYNIKDKYKASVKFKFITESFHNSLLDIYESFDALYFVPFPTTTSWEGKAFPVLWTGDFDFTYSHNVKVSGFSGKILIEERTSV